MAMRIGIAISLCVLLLLTSCFSTGAALVIGLVLNDAAPTRVMSGKVLKADATPAEGMLVQLKASIGGDDDTLVFSDETDANGDYSTKFRWNSEVHYTLRVVTPAGAERYSESLGQLEKVDHVKNITLP